MSGPELHDVARARERFLGGADSHPDLGIRDEILASWRRSLMHGLTPAGALPRATASVDPDGQLLRAARPLLQSKRDAMSGLRGGLTLTDSSGRLLERWVEDTRFARRLDARHVVAGMCISELAVGTNSSGIALETGRPAVVVGHEHFSDGALSMTSAGVPIRHPLTRRVVGTLNLTCAAEDTNPLLLPWVTELVTQIEARLFEGSSRGQRALFAAFLTSAQDARHPVICLDENTVITNVAAARLLDATDQAMLWELASRRLGGDQRHEQPLSLSTGYDVDVTCEPVSDGDRLAGAMLHLTTVRAKPSRTTPAVHSGDAKESSILAPLPGRSPAWRKFVSEVSRERSARQVVLIAGEVGTSKGRVARLLAAAVDEPMVIDAERVTGGQWLDTLRSMLDRGQASVVLRRVDLLDSSTCAATARLLSTRILTGTHVTATFQTDSDGTDIGSLLDWPGSVVVAPPLRERLDDLPDILASMTAELRDGGDRPSWTAEVIQVLSRLTYPANLQSLRGMAEKVCEQLVGPRVFARDLPAHYAARGSRRQLSGLEQIEAHAIMNALHAAQGNKREAADALGIARSTLYRKVRALGLDLSSSAF